MLSAEIMPPLTRALYDVTSDIIGSFNVALDDIFDIVAVGNTAMLHFYTELDPSGIARAPFKPQSLLADILAMLIFRAACRLM